jgi:hypothetical protein
LPWPPDCYLRNKNAPEWGLGVVTHDASKQHAHVFFIHGGRRRMPWGFAAMEVVPDPATHCTPLQVRTLTAARYAAGWMWAPYAGSTNVYVIELSKRVFEEFRFASRNPNYRRGMECFYVGRSIYSPEERFDQHRRGHLNAEAVTQHGVGLRPEFFSALNPMPEKVAEEMEPALAEYLRSLGHAVWQN